MTKDEIASAITEAVKLGVQTAINEGNVALLGDDHRKDHEFVRSWRVEYEDVQKTARKYTLMGILFLSAAVFVVATLKSFGLLK